VLLMLLSLQDLLARLSSSLSPIEQYLANPNQVVTCALLSFQDLLARLSSSLSPIEQYAVRHLP
jgi:hypothetical protein